MSKLTPEEMRALDGLIKGDLAPLTELLSLERETLHPIIQRRLVIMLENWDGTDFEVIAKRAKPHNQTSQYKAKKRARDRDIAERMIELGADKRALRDRIAETVAKEFEVEFEMDIKPETVRKIYDKHRASKARLLRVMNAQAEKANDQFD